MSAKFFSERWKTIPAIHRKTSGRTRAAIVYGVYGNTSPGIVSARYPVMITAMGLSM